MTLIELPYSLMPFGFEQFEAIEGFEDCGEPVPGALPVYAADDVAFQLQLSGSPDEIDALCAGWKDIKLKLLSGCNYKDEDTEPDVIKTYTGRFKVWIRGTTEAILYWPHGLPGIENDIECDACFQLAVQVNTHLFPSACLKRICNPCHTALIEYYCEENAYGFQYCETDILNRARVPVKLSKPQISDDEEVYFDSEGTKDVLSSVSKKEYELTTDFLTEQQHEALKMALSHDFTWIRSPKYNGEISKSGVYEIEWPDNPDYPVATAKTKVRVSPYAARNSNCAVCEPVVECSETECSPVIGIVGVAQMEEDETVECPAVTDMSYEVEHE